MNSELEISELVQKKDEEAFTALYYSSVDMLYSYGLKLGYEGADIEDAIHDLFVKIYLNRGKYTFVANVKAYLIISLKNTLLNKVSKASVIELQTDKHEVMEEGIEDEWINRESNEEKQALLHRCLDILTPRQREVVYFRYFKQCLSRK